jgi:hypothetical protein
MAKFHTSVLTSAALAALLTSFAFEPACAAPAGTETPDQAAPQGEDRPGADDEVQMPSTQQGEVIKPPPTGDEGIHAQVPNPNAGPGDEIAPPSQMPDNENAERK